jgi:exo-1,4-beta-D-glucosaminidase
MRIRSMAGEVLDSRELQQPPVAAGATVTAVSVEVPEGAEPTYFLELDLVATSEDRRVVSSSVYWLSTEPDVLALDETTWQYTPASAFADLRGLETLPPPSLQVDAQAALSSDGLRVITTVTIHNASADGTPAVGVHAALQSAAGLLVAPVIWSENDVTLFARQSATLTAECSAGSLVGGSHIVEIDAFNLTEPISVTAGRAG